MAKIEIEISNDLIIGFNSYKVLEDTNDNCKYCDLYARCSINNQYNKFIFCKSHERSDGKNIKLIKNRMAVKDEKYLVGYSFDLDHDYIDHLLIDKPNVLQLLYDRRDNGVFQIKIQCDNYDSLQLNAKNKISQYLHNTYHIQIPIEVIKDNIDIYIIKRV